MQQFYPIFEISSHDSLLSHVRQLWRYFTGAELIAKDRIVIVKFGISAMIGNAQPSDAPRFNRNNPAAHSPISLFDVDAATTDNRYEFLSTTVKMFRP